MHNKLLMSILEVLNKKNNTSPNGCTRTSFMGTKITKIGITSDKITGRGGLPLILRYAERIRLFEVISGFLKPCFLLGGKGLTLHQFLKQMIAFFIDGTDMSMSGFDLHKKDSGYAAALECKLNEMASSHQIKRFFGKLSFLKDSVYNKILHELFVWRLHIEKPSIIELGIDTMVMDNDDAKKREGNEATYKKVKGFQPLHISWGVFLIDVLFRKGSSHSNHGTDYIDRVKAIVELIRRRYSQEVPIIICGDSGFADQKAYEFFEEKLGIHYITTGKIYKNTKEYIQSLPVENFKEFGKNKAVWKYIEFGSKLDSWKKFRRCVFTKLHRDETGQFVLDIARPDNIIFTNIGASKIADEKLKAAGGNHYFKAETIVRKSHERGADELIHRSLKELATKEQLPFKSFGANRAYYFLLVITHFIFETYKQDITHDVVPVTSYPNTFRRKLIDFAAKITSSARQVVLKISNAINEIFQIEELWERCNTTPQIQLE